MSYGVYSLCWHDIFHALRIRLILRAILSMPCGFCFFFSFGGEGVELVFISLWYFISHKREQSL